MRDRLLFALLGLVGLRIGQALGLRHEDLRPWARGLELVSRVDNVNGARGKGSRGTVPVLPEILQLYLLYMEHEYGLLDSDYVFVNLWGGEIGAPMKYSAVDKLVSRTERRVGFAFTPHDLRHTFVTMLRREQVPSTSTCRRDNAYLYGQHCSVTGCERPGNDLIVESQRLCQRHPQRFKRDTLSIGEYLAAAPVIAARSELTGLPRYDLTAASTTTRDELRFLMQAPCTTASSR